MSGGGFTTRPGIAASQLGGNGLPLTREVLADQKTLAAMLAELGMPPSASSEKAKLFTRVAAALADFGDSSTNEHCAVFVPGRVEFLGKHTDYCGGRSLLCTVDRGFCFVATARNDQQLNIINADTDERASFELTEHLAPTVGHWTNYPMTVARRACANFGPGLKGCDIAFISDLPQAAGLSSSSAFIIGTFLILSAVNALHEHTEYVQNISTREALANYLGCCENGTTFGTLIGSKGVGTLGGSQDHTAILCGKPNHISMFSFCPARHHGDVWLPQNLLLQICPSGVKAEKTGAAMDRYNAVALRARKLVELWNISTNSNAKYLAEITNDEKAHSQLKVLAKEHDHEQPELQLSQRLEQFVHESDRLIPAAFNALGSKSWSELGRLVDESQWLAESHLRNQIPQTIAIQRGLRKSGALAASAFGAGFGGSVWGLVETEVG